MLRCSDETRSKRLTSPLSPTQIPERASSCEPLTRKHAVGDGLNKEAMLGGGRAARSGGKFKGFDIFEAHPPVWAGDPL